MNGDFWNIVAQVSATFVGLVFVGQVFYLSNIKDAIEMQIVRNYSLDEISTSTMILCISTNLILFLYPLLIALCLITTESHQSLFIWEIFWSIALALILTLLVVNYAKSKLQLNSKENNSPISNLIISRSKWGLGLIYFSILVTVGLLLDFRVR